MQKRLDLHFYASCKLGARLNPALAKTFLCTGTDPYKEPAWPLSMHAYVHVPLDSLSAGTKNSQLKGRLLLANADVAATLHRHDPLQG